MIEYAFGSQYKHYRLAIWLLQIESWADDRVGGDKLKVVVEKIAFSVHFLNIIINKLNKCKIFYYKQKKAYSRALLSFLCL